MAADSRSNGSSGIQAADASTIAAAARELSGAGGKHWLARILPFLGPAFIASVAYVDPGNYATNIQAGSKYGYLLLWVVLGSNLMAMLLQSLSAKLGIATGKNLAEHCRDQFHPAAVRAMWGLMEIVAMATDLAEFLGAAVGFNLLLGIPLWLAGILTGIATLAILGLERYGFRPLEAVISSFVGVIALSYLIETVLARPDWGAIALGAALPRFGDAGGALLATGILGATVMPHVIFLHSALTQRRIVVRDPVKMRALFRFQLWDVVIAMGIAGLVNAAMLIMAAATFHVRGHAGLATIEEAHRTLTPLLGSAASAIFAISLVASALSSASVGTMAGQVIMQGFLRRGIAVWVRRLVTMLPSLVVISLGLDPTRTLVISQVVLSFGLPFAVVPLILFTRRGDLMGVLVNRRATTWIAALVAVLIVALNLYLIYQTLFC
jgi:manganese transport protein